MEDTLQILFTLLAFLPGCLSLDWSANLVEGATVYVCEGDDAQLPWQIAPDAGEQVIDTSWIFHGHSDQMMAIYSHGLFLPTPTYSQRVQYVANAGISLSHVTQADGGNYTVEVNTDNGAGGHLMHRHTIILYVASVSRARADATMNVRQEPVAVYDSRTGQYHVQLLCVSHGQQPAQEVIWTTPYQQMLRSALKDGDAFSLLLPNPVTGGNYTCRIPSDSPAATCLPRNDPILDGATVYVDRMEARVTLLEAEQKALQKENDILKTENADLRQHVQNLERISGHHVSFQARLSSDRYVSEGHTIVMDTVITNEGHAYNSRTGDFTAPFNGTYLFLATTGPYAGGYSYLDIVREGTAICSIRTYWGTNSNSEMGTCHAVVHLSAGQQVWLRSEYTNAYFESDISSFSGYLIKSE